MFSTKLFEQSLLYKIYVFYNIYQTNKNSIKHFQCVHFVNPI